MYQEFTEQQLEIRDQIRNFVKKEITHEVASHWDEENKHPEELINRMRKELGVNGLTIPEEYGGWGLGSVEQCLVTEELSRGCLGISLCFGYTGLGILPILKGASHEQKKKWLQPVIDGEYGISFCLSEPGAGSDVPGMSTTAVKKGDKWVINGTKQWITGGGSAGAYTVFAYTDKGRGTRGVSCFYVKRDTPGLTVGKKEDKLGIRASDTRQIIFEDCAVEEANMIGRENLGFIYALQTLNASRPYVAAMGVGVSQAALDYASKYARQREQFGSKISSFQAVRHMLADMSIGLETSRQVTYLAARMADADDPRLPKYSAIAKAHASETAMKCALDAVQIFGGYGYTKEYPVEKLMRDAKILCIFEGTTQIQKNEIAAYVIREAASAK
ncbi:acyl-CoA dehydrogenase family protein [Leptospira borgpetersenii serovar Ballum]|uniref:acyl-CoA dehydrogenase family protein n=1 Tax=Leptospira borgpetersenii TaxID=174 RepID=UPI0018800A03|nr:acyl-CoA dehydrogenase family protein [Leptospira borgpetersenii]MBE8410293.1 acyl-CoA dehydrogenase family protein [Leptospira borgpetersenii serovar Ballum]